VSSPTACSGSDGLGRYEAARDAARQVFERDDVIFGYLAVAELAEAAARTGEVSQVQAALDWLSERTRVTPTAWVLGIEARIRALLSDGQAADGCYRESVERLGGTRVRAELARSHLLYGEWLRRERRRTEAREQLRIAHRMLEEMGMEAFAERARRELRATGETARTRTVPAARAAGAGAALTPQEAQVARLARDGLSNPEIGSRMFISPRTVQYHLSRSWSRSRRRGSTRVRRRSARAWRSPDGPRRSRPARAATWPGSWPRPARA
jgi:DNA-binding CsgD family transcriptional regulator